MSSSIDIRKIYEDSLFFRFDTILSKTIYVALDHSSIDMEKDHYITSDIQLNPEKMEIYGARSILSTYSDTLILRIGHKSISSSFDEEVPFYYPRSDFVEIPLDEVQVSFAVEAYEERVRPLKIDTIVNLSRYYVIDSMPRLPKVHFYGK